MIVVFNLLALAILAAGCAAGALVTVAGGGLFTAAAVASLTAVTIDLVVRRRQRKGLFAIDGGGLMLFLPVWVVALAGLLAASLVALSLPPDWDRPARRAADAGAAPASQLRTAR